MKITRIAIIFVFICSVTSSSHGVVIAGVNGLTNTNAPADDPGFNYIGVFQNDRSSVYLGGSWFLTANHNGAPSAVTMGGSTYSYMASSWKQLTNSTGGIDLALFRITSAPVGGVSIGSVTPSLNNPVVMIGNGRDRTSDLIKWNSSWQVVTQGSYTYSGYTYDGTYPYDTSLRWGSNTISGVASTNLGTGQMDFIITDFDNITGEGQGAPGDSGGGIFTKTGSGWELAGIMLYAHPPYVGQPASTAVFGNSTYAADVSSYRDQINQMIPEPSTGVLLVGISIVFGVIKRLRYMYQ